MKHYKLTIPGLLPGLNEYVDAERGAKGKYKAAAMKKQAENVIGYMIKTQLRGVRFTRPVVIHYTWIEPNRRRDKDNIAFAKKFIQDSLVHAKISQIIETAGDALQVADAVAVRVLEGTRIDLVDHRVGPPWVRGRAVGTHGDGKDGTIEISHILFPY